MSQNFKVEMVEVPSIVLAVMEHRGDPELLAETIQRFIQWRRQHQLSPQRARTFNLVYHDPSAVAAQDYRFDICCSVAEPLTDPAAGIVSKTIEAGRCARVRFEGDDQPLVAIIQWLHQQWLPQSGYQLRDFPMFFERVQFAPLVAESEAVSDVYLPLV